MSLTALSFWKALCRIGKMHNTDIVALQKEIEELGIINIEADEPLTVDILRDVIQVVKDIDLDFDKIAKQIEEREKAYI